MPRKRTSKQKEKPISDKQRAADDTLRALLRNADLKTFDKALAKAIKPTLSR